MPGAEPIHHDGFVRRGNFFFFDSLINEPIVNFHDTNANGKKFSLRMLDSDAMDGGGGGRKHECLWAM